MELQSVFVSLPSSPGKALPGTPVSTLSRSIIRKSVAKRVGAGVGDESPVVRFEVLVDSSDHQACPPSLSPPDVYERESIDSFIRPRDLPRRIREPARCRWLCRACSYSAYLSAGLEIRVWVLTQAEPQAVYADLMVADDDLESDDSNASQAPKRWRASKGFTRCLDAARLPPLVQVSECVCMCVCVYVCVFVCLCVCVRVRVLVCLWLRACVSMCDRLNEIDTGGHERLGCQSFPQSPLHCLGPRSRGLHMCLLACVFAREMTGGSTALSDFQGL